MPSQKLKINYDYEQDKILDKFIQSGIRPKVLIHSCCAPCSTYVLEKLAKIAEVTIFFYNPNIHPKEEYYRRQYAQIAFIKAFNLRTNSDVKFIAERYQPKEFYAVTKDLIAEKEGIGARCAVCYELRMDEAVKKAKALNFAFFASALTLSPRKNSGKVNEIGFMLAEKYGIKYLPSDFKKQNGYKRSIELCKEYDVYRQCYCGCVFAANQQGIDLRMVIFEAKKALGH